MHLSASLGLLDRRVPSPRVECRARRIATSAWQAYLGALLSGLAIGAAFFHPALSWLAWLAPGAALLFALEAAARHAAFSRAGMNVLLAGLVAGVGHPAISGYWLLNMPYPWGRLWVFLLVTVWGSVFVTTWIWISWRILPADASQNARTVGAGNWRDTLARCSLRQRMIWLVSVALARAALEVVRSRFAGGLPWNFIGTSQVDFVPLIQMASIIGVYGVSFLVVWFSVSLGCCVVLWGRATWASQLVCFGAPTSVIGLAVVWGALQLDRQPAGTRCLKTALIQPSIAQKPRFSAEETESRFEKLMALTREALAVKPRLVVWPENCVVGFDNKRLKQIGQMAAENNIWLLLGAGYTDKLGHGKSRVRAFNAAYLFNPRGKVEHLYKKHRLVMFGEYAPLERWVPWTKHLLAGDGSYTAGPGPVSFSLDSPEVTFSPLICFEDAFPRAVRHYVGPTTDFLVNLTNGAWFGAGAQQWQHAAGAIFRAVENRIPMLRCANNGITCWIGPHGRMRSVFRDDQGSPYGAGFLEIDLPLRDASTPRRFTIYHRWGGWMAIAVVLITVWQAAGGLRLFSPARQPTLEHPPRPRRHGAPRRK